MIENERYGIVELNKDITRGNKWQILNHFVDKTSPFYSESAAVGLRILTEKTNLDKHYHSISKEIFIIRKGHIVIAIFKKEETEKREATFTLLKDDFFVINPGVIHEITYFYPETEILIILTPNIPNDKIIVE